MPKMKVNLGTPAAPNWVVMDAKDALTLQGKSAADFTLVGHGHQAKDISIADAGNVITASDVEGALQESFKQIGNLTTLTTTAKGDLVSAIKEVKAGNDYATNAGKVNNIQLQMNAGILEYNDGSGWKIVASSSIKSIQRGVTTIGSANDAPAGPKTVTVTISAVDFNKAVLITTPGSFTSRARLISGTQIEFYNESGSKGEQSWQVVEYN